MAVEILGLGSALPEGSLTQDDAAHAASALRRFDEGAASDRQHQLLSVLYRRSGVRKRHSVLLSAGQSAAVQRQSFYELAKDREDRGPTTADRMQQYEIEAPKLAEQACRRALETASVSESDIQHLVTVSCSGFNSPGFDLELYRQLNLAPTTSRTHVGFMGCHGALNGLRIAKALAQSNPGQRVMLCAVELCSLHHQYTDDPQQIVANSLFADGAAAAVIQHAESNTDEITGAKRSWRVVDSASFLIPDSSEAMSWRIGDHGFTMTLSAIVPEVIKLHLKPWLVSWIARFGLKITDIATWAIHPGGPRIVSAAVGALDLPENAAATSLSVLAECGNMSSPTILFILQRLLAENAPGPCIALAFGPGLVVEAALLM